MSEVHAKDTEERFSDFAVVIVTEALSHVSIPDSGSVMSCVKRLYDVTLKAEKVIAALPGGCTG